MDSSAGDVVSGYRSREAEAFDLVASEFLESLQLFGLLDTFGDRYEVEHASDPQNCLYEAGGFVVS